MDQQFILQTIDQHGMRLFHAIEIVDLFLSPSYLQHGELRHELIEEGKSAAIAFLRQFLSDRIPRREAAMAEEGCHDG